MSLTEYLESEPLSEIIRYQTEVPQDAVAFIGTLRKHPYDVEKCLLIGDAGDFEPAILEFRVADVAGMEELASPVDETGQSRSLAKLWVRRGSYGIRYEPFEVENPPRFHSDSSRLHERIMHAIGNRT
jgi:inorganic pyrophosphatase